MNKNPQNLRYLPQELNTKYDACKLYVSNNWKVKEIARRYKISKASLMRWMIRYDGTKESLRDLSHKPLTIHPNAHTKQEIHD